MSKFRATFTIDLAEGRDLDAEYVRTAFEEALEDVTSTGFFATDDDDHESEYAVTVDVVELVP